MREVLPRKPRNTDFLQTVLTIIRGRRNIERCDVFKNSKIVSEK